MRKFSRTRLWESSELKTASAQNLARKKAMDEDLFGDLDLTSSPDQEDSSLAEDLFASEEPSMMQVDQEDSKDADGYPEEDLYEDNAPAKPLRTASVEDVLKVASNLDNFSSSLHRSGNRHYARRIRRVSRMLKIEAAKQGE